MKIKEYRKKLNSSFQDEKIPNVLEKVKNTNVFGEKEYCKEVEKRKSLSFSVYFKLAFTVVICVFVLIIGLNNGLNTENQNGASDAVGGAMEDNPDKENNVPESPEKDEGNEGAAEEGSSSGSSGKDENNFESITGVDKEILEQLEVYIMQNSPSLEETIIFANSNKISISEKIIEEFYNKVKEENKKPGE